MKAITYRSYGSPDILKLHDVEQPIITDDEVLVRVHAAAVNPLDWHYLTGTPYLMHIAGAGLVKPKRSIPGQDVAGTVESVGARVTQLQPGDEVFGWSSGGGCLAEFVAVPENQLVRKPAQVTFEQAAAVPIAAFTALQALRDKGRLQPGQNVLINGASGGVGTFAAQIAKALGAQVTAVCSTRNADIARSLGADHVIDYTREDFTQTEQRYDLLVDIPGNRSLSDCRRVLKPEGIYVLVGGSMGRWLGPLPLLIKARMTSMVVSQKLITFIAQSTREDLLFLSHLLERGELTPVIDRTYPLSDASTALRYQGEKHSRGKIVMTVASHGAASS